MAILYGYDNDPYYQRFNYPDPYGYDNDPYITDPYYQRFSYPGPLRYLTPHNPYIDGTYAPLKIRHYDAYSVPQYPTLNSIQPALRSYAALPLFVIPIATFPTYRDYGLEHALNRRYNRHNRRGYYYL